MADVGMGNVEIGRGFSYNARELEVFMKFKAFLVILLAIVTLVGCGRGAENAQAGNTQTGSAQSSGGQAEIVQKSAHAAENAIYVGVAQDFDSLDPHHMTAAGTKEVMFNVFEGLVKPNAAGEIVPAVAEAVQVSNDGLTYTFKLRSDVKFHNGQDVQVEDVLFSFQRRMDGKDSASYLPALSVIKSINAENQQIVIQLNEPSNEFLAAVMNVYIIPEGYEEQEVSPIGTGPYRFQSRKVQDSLVLKSFEQYWGEKPAVDTIVFKIMESADGLILGLQSGALDLVAHMSSDQTAQLSAQNFDIYQGSMNMVQALYINNAVAPFDDLRVRQALCYAVDRDAIIDLVFDGYGIPLGTSMFPSFSKYYLDQLTDYYPHDVEKAKALLAQAGYPNGFSMTITVPSNYTPHVNTATVIIEQLREVGITATLNLVDWSTWLAEVYGNRNYQTTVTGVSSDNMTARKLLERFGTTTGNNFTNYSNAEYDSILAQALTEIDDAKQTELYKKLEINLTENAANVYIQDMADLVAVRKGITGLTFYPLYVLDVACLSWDY